MTIAGGTSEITRNTIAERIPRAAPRPAAEMMANTGRVPSDVHPDLRRIAFFAPRALVTPRTLPLMRVLTRLQGRRGPADVEVITLASGAGVRLFRPSGVTEPAPALLWIHGGGYVIGSAQMDDRLCRRFSAKLGITVASVEYRLAAEHPYPDPPEDCYSVLTWLAGLPSVDPGRVAIAGASAGGGLAAALALLARDRGELHTGVPRCWCNPMLDDREFRDRPEEPQLPAVEHAQPIRFGWAAYPRRRRPAGSPSPGAATT